MLWQQIPWLVAMGVLVGGSAFFSCSEAALFLLSPQDRHAFASGSRTERIAADLLLLPERLLSTVLFCNLLVNLAFFSISSILSIHLQKEGHTTAAGVVAVGSFLVVILVGEMLPKCLAVMKPRLIAALVAVPMSAMARMLDPIMPLFNTTVLLSRRLLWPRLAEEPYLEVADLERAVELSTTDAALLEQEKTVLQNIVALSEMRVDEIMRPRMRFRAFRPPVGLADLEGRVPASGYVLVSEPESEEVAAAIPLDTMAYLPREHLEYYAEDVIYVPWSTTAAEAFDRMRERERSVAAVVNEFGETIGILTLDDVLDTVFRQEASRSQRLFRQSPIEPDGDGAWLVTGMTTLRRLSRQFDLTLPHTTAVTMAGVVQEVLERLPLAGDRCRWGPFALEVLTAPDHGQLRVRLTLAPNDESAEEGATA